MGAVPTGKTQLGTALVGLGGAGAVAQAFLDWRDPHLGYPPKGGDYPEGLAIAWLGAAALTLIAGWGMRNRFYDVAGWALILGMLVAVPAVCDVLIMSGADTGLYLAAQSGVLLVVGAVFAIRGQRESPPAYPRLATRRNGTAGPPPHR